MKPFKLNIAKKEVDFIETSFKPYGLSCMSNPAFLNNVIDFGKMGKDKINEETIEFLVPYLEIEGFNPQVHAVPLAPPGTIAARRGQGSSCRKFPRCLWRSQPIDAHLTACRSTPSALLATSRPPSVMVFASGVSRANILRATISHCVQRHEKRGWAEMP